MKESAPTFSRRRFIQSSLGFSLLYPLALRAGELPEEAFVPKRFHHYDDAVLVAGEPPAITPGSFTIAVLPDTQRYAKDNPEGFSQQTAWIAEQAEARNIAFVLHLGDITDNNVPEQWDLAQQAMKRLDGKVPYFMTLGNHDYSEEGRCKDRTTLYNDYFPLADYRQRPTFGGVYDREPEQYENSFHKVEAGGKKWLVLCLEFGPRKDVVRWANEVVAQHPDHQAILVTHAYMYFNDTRYDWKKHGTKQRWNPHSYPLAEADNDDVTDGEELWQGLVSRHPNFAMTLNGHVLDDGLGLLSSPHGDSHVHQMLCNYQMRPNGGDTWLRLIEMKADGTAQVCDYAPGRGERNESSQNCFALKW